METIPIPFCSVYRTGNTITVTLLCHNCQNEIDFSATFKTLQDVPVFKSVAKCPHCRLFFLNNEDRHYRITPIGGKTIARLLDIAAAIETRKATTGEAKERKWCIHYFRPTARMEWCGARTEQTGKFMGLRQVQACPGREE